MYYTIQNQSLNVEIFRAQFCLLEWSPGRPNLVFGDQNLNLVASVIEVGDRKFWIISIIDSILVIGGHFFV
jgi:hypothetical protein